MNGPHFMVDDLQAVEPDELPRDGEVEVSLADEKDSMGFDRVELRARTREALLEYVREHWGDGDAAWFETYVEDRVLEVGGGSPRPRRTLIVAFDVSEMTEEEADHLVGYVLAQGESSDDYPDTTGDFHLFTDLPLGMVQGAIEVGAEGAPA